MPAYGKNGVVRERMGNRTGQSSPIGSYQTADGRYMVLSVSTERVWARMIEAMGHPEWGTDPRFATNPARTAHANEVDALVGGWFGEHTADGGAAHPGRGGRAGLADLFDRRHLRRPALRGARRTSSRPPIPSLVAVPMPAVLPRFSRTPGAVHHTGPTLGEHNAYVYGEVLGLSDAERDALSADGVI